MTREQRISKLVNAIIAYRGKRKGLDGPWIVDPKPSKREDVLKWIERLGLPVGPDPQAIIDIIDGFKSMAEMHKWINLIRWEITKPKEAK